MKRRRRRGVQVEGNVGDGAAFGASETSATARRSNRATRRERRGVQIEGNVGDGAAFGASETSKPSVADAGWDNGWFD
ncbi:MAG: hypothetical protein IJZ10_10250 [Thermoguttaceae bacterium]|nr:hypothetical protein [Thermoguttaceae bacterium]